MIQIFQQNISFSLVINLLKTKYKDFKLFTFNELFYHEKEEKKYLINQENDYNKK